MENKKSDVVEINLADLGKELLRKLWIIILAAAATVIVMFAVVKITFVPKYSSVATIYILKQEGETTSSDFSLALNVVKDCTFILKSHAVLDEVKNQLGLSQSYSQLSNSITTNNPSNTRILQVTVEADTPEEAKRIVDAVCTIGVQNIEKAMGFAQANFYEYGVLNNSPSNRLRLRYYGVAGLAAAIVAAIVIIIIYISDDSIKTADDIAERLGLTVLAEIPSLNEKGKGYRGYGGYGGYGYGYGQTSGKTSGKKSAKGGAKK